MKITRDKAAKIMKTKTSKTRALKIIKPKTTKIKTIRYNRNRTVQVSKIMKIKMIRVSRIIKELTRRTIIQTTSITFSILQEPLLPTLHSIIVSNQRTTTSKRRTRTITKTLKKTATTKTKTSKMEVAKTTIIKTMLRTAIVMQMV